MSYLLIIKVDGLVVLNKQLNTRDATFTTMISQAHKRFDDFKKEASEIQITIKREKQYI